MQTISEDEDEKSNSGGTNPMDLVICIGKVSRYVKGKYVGRFGGRRNRIQISREIFGRIKKRVWRRR